MLSTFKPVTHHEGQLLYPRSRAFTDHSQSSATLSILTVATLAAATPLQLTSRAPVTGRFTAYAAPLCTDTAPDVPGVGQEELGNGIQLTQDVCAATLINTGGPTQATLGTLSFRAGLNGDPPAGQTCTFNLYFKDGCSSRSVQREPPAAANVCRNVIPPLSLDEGVVVRSVKLTCAPTA